MAENEKLEVSFGAPDSDTCQIAVNRPLGSGSPAYYSSPEEAQNDPLARKLVDLEELEAVLIADQSITLLKPVDGAPWEGVIERVEKIIVDHFEGLDRVQSQGQREMTPDEKELAARVQEVLNTEINPMVASHGGFIEVLDLKEKTVFIHMGGGCQGCGMASVTLKQGVERVLTDHVPEIEQILDTTDHAAGTNPYYAPTTK